MLVTQRESQVEGTLGFYPIIWCQPSLTVYKLVRPVVSTETVLLEWGAIFNMASSV